MARMLFIAAGPQLFASLSEQFAALGGHALHRLDPQEPDTLQNVDSDAAAIVDAGFCDAAAMARRLRTMGLAGKIIVIGEAPKEADAALARPFRFADLLAELACPHSPNLEDALRGRLTEKEAAILNRLMRAEGAIISKAALLADVWGYGPNVSTRTLETHIHRLRRKIEPDPRRPRRLLTEEGGYRFSKSSG
jgi:hypothetical protein